MLRILIAAPGVVAAAVVTLAGVAPQHAYGQPGRYHQQTYPQAAAAQYPQYQQPAVQPQTAPYRVAAQPAAQQPSNGSYQLPQYTANQYQVPQYQAAGQYQAPAPGSYYSVAQNDSAATESVPTPPAAPAHVPPAASATTTYPQAASHAPSDCGCNPGVAPAATNWDSYLHAPATTAGCDVSYAGGYGNGCAAGDCNYGTFGGMSGGNLLGGRLAGAGAGRQWFFGAYALYMGRDRPGYEKFAVNVDSPAAYPYYPTQSDTILSTTDIDPDFQWGAEIRFGSTFGQACDPCGPRPYAWEVTYWGLSDDEQSVVRTDAIADTDRIYGSVNFAGVEWDRDGAGGTYAYRPLNDYFDYQMPIDDPAGDPADVVRVVGIRVRNNFSAQNLELNFIKFPVVGCDPCSRFSANATCGVRYLKLDEDLQIAVQGSDQSVGTDPVDYEGGFPTDDDNNIFYDIHTDNELVGFQFGNSLNWLVGCKWSLFCDSQLGIYGNRISNQHRIWNSAGGVARFVGDGSDANVRTSKTDVSFLGEARAGVGYQVGCNCRLTTAYRVIAVTGVALSGEQIKGDYSNRDYVGIIDSNDSIVLHGLQTGVEWKY